MSLVTCCRTIKIRIHAQGHALHEILDKSPPEYLQELFIINYLSSYSILDNSPKPSLNLSHLTNLRVLELPTLDPGTILNGIGSE